MKHKIVIGDFDRPGLPFSRKACEALAEMGVPSAKDHMEQHGGPVLKVWVELLGREMERDPWKEYDGEDLVRHDPCLVQIVETLGREATRWPRGGNSRLPIIRVVEIEGHKYVIRKNSRNEERVVVPTCWTVIP